MVWQAPFSWELWVANHLFNNSHLIYWPHHTRITMKPTGGSTNWNQDCREKYQYPQICRWHHPYGRKRRITKESLDESERGEWKSWLKTQHSKNLRSWDLVPSLHGKKWRNSGNNEETLFWGAPKSLQMVTAAMKLKKTLAPWKESYD